MCDASVIEAAAPARLLLIDRDGELGRRLAGPLDAELASPPIVIELSAGRQSLELLRSSEFDVVAADLDALSDLSERLDDRIAKLARAAAGALIVALTSDASISVTLSAMRAGAHDCVCNTLDGSALVARIGELARRHGKSRVSARVPQEAMAEAAPSIPMMRDLVLPMWRQEQRIIEDAIMRFSGNVALAAAALELSPSTIYRKRQAWAESGDKRQTA